MNGLIRVICTKTSWKLDTIDIVNTGNSCTQIVWGNTSQCNKLETNIVSSWDMTVIYQINSSNSHRDVVSFVCNHTLWSQFKNNEHKINIQVLGIPPSFDTIDNCSVLHFTRTYQPIRTQRTRTHTDKEIRWMLRLSPLELCRFIDWVPSSNGRAIEIDTKRTNIRYWWVLCATIFV